MLAILAPAIADGALANPKYASIVIDHNTGRVLHERHADARRYPASLTKMMTRYMVFERLRSGKLELNTPLKVSKRAAGQPPSKIGFKPGETIRVIDAIRILVTKSANDVATTVAENLAGSETEFARRMTQKARSLGLKNTTFRNASGLPNAKQVTTARDMAAMARRMMRDFPEYYGYFRTRYFSYKGKRYRNHNKLLFNYKGTDGVKTGYIRASGFNLAASVKRGKKHLVAVVMGGKTSKSRNAHMRALLDRNWKHASARSSTAPETAPLPLRNPRLDPRPAVVASAGSDRIAALAPASGAMPGMEGIAVDERAPQQALREAAETESASAEGSRGEEGDYHVQVGAYSSRSDAERQLDDVLGRAKQLLEGHEPIAMPHRNLYRARFAGFSREKAKQACASLERRDIDCIVMTAE
jgi:D-alanyl-D-alanine carboxypeptidase